VLRAFHSFQGDSYSEESLLDDEAFPEESLFPDLGASDVPDAEDESDSLDFFSDSAAFR